MVDSTEGDPLKWIIAAIVAVAGWVVTVAMQWGSFSTRIAAVEETQKQKVDRKEYEVGQRDIRDRLGRIEEKLDRNYSRSGGH